MKRFMIAVALVLSMTACATPPPVAPITHYVEVPVPFCPAPDLVAVPKVGGWEHITTKTPPGDVAKHWSYEVEYWKGLAGIYNKQLDLYRTTGKDPDQIKKELQQLIQAAQGRSVK